MPLPSRRVRARLVIAAAFGLLFSFVPLPAVEFVTAPAGAATGLPQLTPATDAQLAAIGDAADELPGTDRVVGEEPETEAFTAIGLKFEELPTKPVFVRVKDAEGAFGDWRELHVEADAGEEGGLPSTATAPFWVGEGTGYEINLGAGDAPGADVVLVRDVLRRTTVRVEPAAGAAIPPPFGINLRDSWGARPARSVSYGTTVRLGVVHHSVQANDYSPGQVPAMIRSVQAYHMDAQGWSDIGYNFVVDRFGGIWEGREGGIDRSVIGAHAMGFNTNSVGVMVIGDYSQITPTAAALESVSKVVGWKLFLFGANPAGRVSVTSLGSTSIPAGVTVDLPAVVGHSEVGATSCPGRIASSLVDIRARAQQWTDFLRAGSGPAGSLDLLSVGPGVVRAVGWAKDPDIDGPALVRLQIDSSTVTTRASGSRPDVAAAFPSYGAATGFDVAMGGVYAGYHIACVTVANEGWGTNDLALGCQQVVVPDPTGLSPAGSITAATGFWGGFDLVGWATDPDGGGEPRQVLIEVDGAVRQEITSRPDGWFNTRLLGVAGGWRRVCTIVRNAGGGTDSRTSCWSVDVKGGSPLGNLDAVTVSGRTISFSGWAADPEWAGPTPVHITYDGVRSYGTTTAGYRLDVDAIHPGFGDRSGFAYQLNVPAGQHTVCAVAINAGVGSNESLGCRTVVVK